MGVFLSQYWCFAVVDKMTRFFQLPYGVRVTLMIVLPYCAAFVLHYAVEEPGAKIIDWLFRCMDRKKVKI